MIQLRDRNKTAIDPSSIVAIGLKGKTGYRIWTTNHEINIDYDWNNPAYDPNIENWCDEDYKLLLESND